MFRALPLPFAPATLDVRVVYEDRADFVWMALQRLGIRSADLEDAFQEVFLVVHRRLHTYDTRAPLSGWLFGICVKVVAAQRRRAHVRREQLVEVVPERASASEDPEHEAAREQGQRHLLSLLDALDFDKRAVFVMFELEEMSCEEISLALGIPVGTVYSRLHAARKAFEKTAARRRSRHESPAGDTMSRAGREHD
jgi:RNA polymerase sigma-70 factor, ECF subfamily